MADPPPSAPPEHFTISPYEAQRALALATRVRELDARSEALRLQALLCEAQQKNLAAERAKVEDQLRAVLLSAGLPLELLPHVAVATDPVADGFPEGTVFDPQARRALPASMRPGWKPPAPPAAPDDAAQGASLTPAGEVVAARE